MDTTILTLGVDSSQVGTASAAFERMAATGNAAAATANKVSFAATANGKAIASTLVPAATKGASAIGQMATAANAVKPNALVLVASSLGITSAEAVKAHAAIQNLNRAIGSTPQFKASIAAPRAALTASAPIAAVASQRFLVPTGIAQLSRDALQAQTAVDRLTASAITQRSALSQLSPAAQSTAASYRQLALTPIANVPRPVNPIPPGAIPAMEGLTKKQNEFTKSSRQAMFQNQQLAFQLNDFAVQVVSGGNPLIALVQQGSQLSGTYGGIGNAVKAVTGLLTPFRLVVGGAATAVGALALAFNESQKRSYDFEKSIALSGNAAGQTEGKINALAAAVSRQSQATQSDVREMAQALNATGRVGPEVFDKATRAAVLYQQVTGKTADEVAKDFAEMARAPAKAAASLGAVSAEQYKAIKAAEDNGDSAKALAILYDALTGKFENLNGKLPFFAERIRFLSRDFDNLRNAVNGIFNPTVEQQIAKLEGRVASMRKSAAEPSGSLLGDLFKFDNSGDIVAAEAELKRLRGAQKAEKDKADKDARGQRGKEASAAIQPLLDRANPQKVFEREKKALEKRFTDMAAAGLGLSKADQSKAIEQLKKQILPTKASGGGGSGFSAASETLRNALERDINGIQQVFERERDAIEFQNRFLQGEYQSGAISLKAFYDQRRANTEQAVNAEIAALDKEAARLAEHLKATKDPSEKVQTQTRIDDIDAEKARIRAQAAQDVELANQEEIASFKALNEQIVNYRASLLEMAGDEKGAAELRAKLAIDNAKVLASQSGGQITAADIAAQARRLDIQIKFNEVQKQTADLSVNAARAEEAFALSAEQRGLSLVETERGIFQVRSKELEQLGALTRQAQALAAASTDPRIKQFAADLALEYAKAADAIDPALNRLREANRDLAAGLAGTISDLPNTFARAYNQRRLDSRDDIKKQQEEYDKRIQNLRGYLAQEQDVREKAKLRKEIQELEGKRAGVKGESKGQTFLNAINESLLKPAGEQVFAAFSKVLIQDPLQKFFENQLKGMTEGGGFLAGFFKDALGIKEDPKLVAEQQQTASITASTQALDLLTRAAQNAANAVRTPPGGATTLPNGEAVPVSDELVGATEEATGATANFGENALSAAKDVASMASSAGLGGNALARLPGIIGLFQSAVAAMAATGGKGGSGIASLIGTVVSAYAGSSGGGAGMTGSIVDAFRTRGGEYHNGGIVGSASASRTLSSAMIAGATRYHSGGIAGAKPDLKQHEVPAVLMGGPKGKREEVLTADDPRHRDNLGMNALAKIMAESKHEGLRVRGARELGGPVSANSMYRVNEKRPELLEVAGKQYLMTGAQGGKVVDQPASGPAGRNIAINVQVAMPAGGDRRTAQQFGADVARASQRHLSRS